MFIRPYEKKDWEKIEKINSEYLPRVPVLYRFNVVRQYYMDLAENARHYYDLRKCRIVLATQEEYEKNKDFLEDLEERLEEIYSKKVCLL